MSLEEVRQLIESFEYDKALELLRTLKPCTESLELKTTIYNRTGKNEKALEIIEKALADKNLTGANRAEIIRKKAVSLGMMNEGIEAEKVINTCAKYYQEVVVPEGDDIQLQLRILYTKGTILKSNGKYSDALPAFEEAYKLASENDDPVVYSLMVNMANLFRSQGDLGSAISYLNQIIDDYEQEKMDNKRVYVLAKSNLSLVYRAQGRFHLADSYLKSSLENFKEMGLRHYILETIQHLIFNAIDMNNPEFVEQYHNLIHSLNLTEVANFDKIIKLPQALILKHKGDRTDIEKARSLLEEIIEQKTDMDPYLIAIYQLCDLLLDQISVDNIKDHTLKLRDLVAELHQQSLVHNDIIATVKALIIESRVATINKDLKESQNLMEKARMFAMQAGLDKLTEDIEKAEDERMSDLLRTNTMLHVCANCKKMRDRNYNWISIEYNPVNLLYKISHGVCPDCTTELYGISATSYD